MKANTDTATDPLKWRTPVYVRIGRGMREPVEGPHRALLYLSTRWPAERSRCHAHAKFACAAAIEQSGSPERARDAFVAAVIEARIHA